LREAEFALTIHRDALAAERPFGKGGPGVGVPGRLQLDLDLLMADTEAICGSSASAEKLASRLETLADQATASEATWLTMAALKCRVAAAIAREDHAGAGRAYADLAPTLPEEEQASAVLRSRLHLGLAGEGAEQLQILSDYPVEGSALIERSLVRGWLRDSLGDFAGARSEFIEAADAAVAADEPYKALRALRNAERCERRAPLLHIGLDSVWQRAQRLEGIVAGRSGDQMTHTRLIRRIESRLGRDGLREAYFTVRAGAFYSWDDIDPAAYEDILVRYASLMRAAAADAPSTELILQAVRATADVCALLDHREAESALAPFLDVLRERLTPEFAERVWREIEESTQTPSGVTGGLMLAIDLADKWRFADRDARLGALLRRGLAVGFGGRGEDGSASKAIDLILKLSPALEGAEAGAVRDQVTSMLAVAPGHSLNDYLNAVARTTAHAPPPEDGGQSLFDILLRCERQAAEHGASPQWLGALAMLHREASGAPKERLASLLRDRASTAKGASAAGWHAAERALAGGIELPDELADRYLKEMTDLLGALRAQTRKTGLGGGASDVIPLTRWAATKASPAVRERALRAGIEFLGYPEHLLYERVRWIPFIAHLARSSPSMIPEATEALLLAAKGGLTPAGDFDAFTNPFAFFRVTGHTDEGIRSSAIHGLATFMPAADQAGRQIIVDALRSAVGAVEPEVRLAAAIGAGWAVRELLHCPEAVITLEQVVLRPLAGDPVARIALAAYKGLLEGRFTEPTQM